MCDAAGDVEAAQQTAGELLGLEFHEFLQAHEGDRLVDQAAAGGAVAHVQGTEGVDVLRNSELVEDRDVLGHHADTTFESVGCGRHGLAENPDRPLVVGEQLEDAADRRRLARTVGAEQTQHLAARNPQGQAVHRDEFPVAFDQGLDLHSLIRIPDAPLEFHLSSSVPAGVSGSWPHASAALVAAEVLAVMS